MLGMLIKVLCGDSIATRRRLPSEGNVTFEDLMRGTSERLIPLRPAAQLVVA
jgi:hypothetical protein